mgnify:FL=1
MKEKITIEKAKKIVKQIIDEALFSIQSGIDPDEETIAMRMLYQLEHPEVIKDDK